MSARQRGMNKVQGRGRQRTHDALDEPPWWHRPPWGFGFRSGL